MAALKREIPLSLLMRWEGSDLWLWYSVGSMLLPAAAEDDIKKPSEDITDIFKDLTPLGMPETQETLWSILLNSQLRQCVRLPLPYEDVNHPNKIYHFAHKQDIKAARACPVLLCSFIPDIPAEQDEMENINPLPPIQHGTAALVIDGEKVAIYKIAQLTEQVQKQQLLLSEQLKPSIPDKARSDQAQLNLTFIPASSELQNMIQALAHEYLHFHQAQVAAHTRKQPASSNIFEGRSSAEVSASLPFQAVAASLHDASSGAKKWNYQTGHPPYYNYNKKSFTAIIEYRDSETDVFDDKTTDSLWKQVKSCNDHDVDVLMALIAHLIRSPEQDGAAWFFAPHFLDYRGVKPIMKADTPGGTKRRAGHRQEDIAGVEKSINRLENIWLNFTQSIDDTQIDRKTKKRKKTEFIHKGRLLMIEEIWTQRELDTDALDRGMEIGWKVRPGGWLKTFLEEPNRQVAHLCQKSLQYDPYRELWAKRLSRYFMFHGHINTRGGGGMFNREIGKLLQEVSLETDARFPQRTRDRFEKAMNTLAEDKLIAEWSYTEQIELPAKSWLPSWLEQKITVHIMPTRGIKHP